MAQTISQAGHIASQAHAVARSLRSLFSQIDDLLTNNTTQSVNWGEPPAYVTSALQDGNLPNHDFSPADLSNFIGTLASINTLLDSGHRGNVYKIAPD